MMSSELPTEIHMLRKKIFAIELLLSLNTPQPVSETSLLAGGAKNKEPFNDILSHLVRNFLREDLRDLTKRLEDITQELQKEPLCQSASI